MFSITLAQLILATLTFRELLIKMCLIVSSHPPLPHCQCEHRCALQLQVHAQKAITAS